MEFPPRKSNTIETLRNRVSYQDGNGKVGSSKE